MQLLGLANPLDPTQATGQRPGGRATPPESPRKVIYIYGLM